MLIAVVGSLAGCSSESSEVARLESLPIELASVSYPALLTDRAASDGANTSFPLADFGFYSPADATTTSRTTFWAPIGTDVHAPVTGTVRAVVTSAIGDVGIQIDGGSGATWELVHVSAPTVKAGERVTAGQAVGKVSGGLVELGLVIVGEYECPFAEGYVDSAARDQIFGDLAAARAKIEALLGDQSYFDQPAWESENCISLGFE